MTNPSTHDDQGQAYTDAAADGVWLALVSEEFDEWQRFPSEDAAKWFADGYSTGGLQYGAGHCSAYTKAEVDEAATDDGKWSGWARKALEAWPSRSVAVDD